MGGCRGLFAIAGNQLAIGRIGRRREAVRESRGMVLVSAGFAYDLTLERLIAAGPDRRAGDRALAVGSDQRVWGRTGTW
jgi:hypothetical protein